MVSVGCWSCARADILMPDLQRVGGVSEFMRVGHMAESYDIPVSSHLFPETSLQVLGALSNANFLEYMPWFSELYREASTSTTAGRGARAAGLGLHFRPRPHRHLQRPQTRRPAKGQKTKRNSGRKPMKITRREFTIGGRLPQRLGSRRSSARADRTSAIGWLAALTGPSSAPAIGFNRGVVFAAEAINAAGGVKGRKIEIVTRDTQGDPTKAVNATQELISSASVHAVWGPTNSGESLAVTPIMARSKMPNIHPCVVDSLIDPQKFPNAFRISPSNTQWDDAVSRLHAEHPEGDQGRRHRRHHGLRRCRRQSLLRGPEKGWRRSRLSGQYRCHAAGHDTGYAACTQRRRRGHRRLEHLDGHGRPPLQHARAMGWDVPFVGHPSMSSGDIGKLVEKPENWKKVYAVGYRSCSYDETASCPSAARNWSPS